MPGDIVLIANTSMMRSNVGSEGQREEKTWNPNQMDLRKEKTTVKNGKLE